MTPWLAREQFRWLRPDAHRFVRPDAARWQQSNQRLWQASRHWETKYNYNPSQPRVPRGNTGGGQWTDDSNGGGSSLGRIRLAGDIPTGDSPPEIPKERPPKSSERTSILKAAARRLAAGVAFDFLVARAPWILAEQAQIQTYNDSPRTLEELQSEMSTWRTGMDRHHIVEQTSAEEDGFSREVIDSPDNLVRIPRLKHQEITAWYKSANPEFGGESPRDYLRGRSWEVRREVGLEALRLFGVLK